MPPEQGQLTTDLPFEDESVVRRVAMTTHVLRTKVGHSERKRRRKVPVQPVLAAEILRMEHYTIDYRSDAEEMKRLGFESIWQYIAHRHPINECLGFIARPTDFQRFTSARIHAKVVRQAFAAFRGRFLVDHREHPLLMVPRTSDRKQIEVITFNREYSVNETQTAYDVFRSRTKDRMKGRLRSGFEMAEAIGGPGAMRELAEHMEKYIREEYANAQRQPMLRFGDDTANGPALGLT
jgi:hypothetical protein